MLPGQKWECQHEAGEHEKQHHRGTSEQMPFGVIIYAQVIDDHDGGGYAT
jgi:hypothetical protein